MATSNIHMLPARQPLENQSPQQVALQAMRQMKYGKTRASQELNKAWQANAAWAKSGNPGDLQVRAAAAQNAYDVVISVEKARYTAAFALLAHSASSKAAQTDAVAKTIEDARHQKSLIESGKVYRSRQYVMMQAAASMDAALKSVPPLPDSIGQSAISAQGDQNAAVTVNAKSGWRGDIFNKRVNIFPSREMRAAAEGLAGVAGPSLSAANTMTPAHPTRFMEEMRQRMADGVMAFRRAAHVHASETMHGEVAAGLQGLSGALSAADAGSGAIDVPTTPPANYTSFIFPVAGALVALGLYAALFSRR